MQIPAWKMMQPPVLEYTRKVELAPAPRNTQLLVPVPLPPFEKSMPVVRLKVPAPSRTYLFPLHARRAAVIVAAVPL